MSGYFTIEKSIVSSAKNLILDLIFFFKIVDVDRE